MPEKTLIVFDLNGVVLRLSLWGVISALWACPRKGALVLLAFNPRFVVSLIRGIYRKKVLEQLIEDLAQFSRFAQIRETALQVISAQNPRKGMVPLLEQLKNKGCQLAILTNIGPRSLDLIGLRHPGLLARFETIACPSPCDGYRAKPAREVFVQFKQRVEPTVRVIYIDDRAANIVQARAVGMQPIHFVGVSSLRKHLKELAIV